MNSALPKITVITPVKNSAKTLANAIESLILQNYPNLEYIIIDAKSSDGTIDVIKKYQKHINYWISEKDEGTSDAYIKGIKKASSDIIAFLNADDFYEKEILLKAGEEFGKNPELDIVSFRYQVIKNSKIIEKATLDDIDFKPDRIPNALGINARFFKKNLFYKYGFPLLRDDKNRPFISNDLEYMIRFALNGVRNKNIDYIGYNYLHHENSLTFNNNLSSQQRLMEDRIFVAKKFLKEQDKLPLSPFWQKSFKKSIKKYRAKLVKSNLKLKKYQKAMQEIYLGLKEDNKFSFLYLLLKTLLRK